MMRFSRTLALALLLSCGAASADIVYLTNGRTIEGKVTRKGDKVIVEQPDGVVILDASKVEHIEKKESILEVYEGKYAAIDEKADGAAAKFVDLGQWARGRDMDNQADACFKKAIELDYNNEAARTALGYAKHDGKWMTRDEIQRARGMVRHGDTWVTPEAKADLARIEALTELERTRAEIERLKLERAQADEARAERAREEAGDAYLYRSYGNLIYGGYVITGSGYPHPQRSPSRHPPAHRGGDGVHPEHSSPSANLPQAHYVQTPRGLKLAPPPPAPPAPPEEPAP